MGLGFPRLAPQTRRQPGEALRVPGFMDRRAGQLNALAGLHQELDLRAAALVRRRAGLPLCVDGCGRCCSTQTPVASVLEAQYAVSTLKVSVNALDRARHWLITPDPAITVYPEADPTVIGGQHGAVVAQAQVPQVLREIGIASSRSCPMLDDDLRCTVHRGRPLACRAYGVAFSPDIFCGRPDPAPDRRDTDPAQGEDLKSAADLLHAAVAKDDAHVAATGFWPRLLLQVADPPGFRELVRSGAVPVAKLAFVQGRPYSAAAVLTEAGSKVAAAQRRSFDRQREGEANYVSRP